MVTRTVGPAEGDAETRGVSEVAGVGRQAARLLIAETPSTAAATSGRT
jgi:hypothetical protein